MPELSARRTALVLIDLQHGIVSLPLQPVDGHEIVARARRMAERFRAAQAPVVLVNVDFGADFIDAPAQPVDAPTRRAGQTVPANWSQLVEDLARPGDLLITKRQWGAFTGTSLEQQLRRRGIDTIVLGGISTNFGVESTARHAWELGFAVVLAQDLCASSLGEMHQLTIQHVMPRIARVSDTGSITLTA